MSDVSSPQARRPVGLAAGVVLLGGCALSALMAWGLHRTVQTMLEERLMHRADAVVLSVEHRVQVYADVIKGLQARFAFKPGFSREDFEATMLELDLLSRHSLIKAISYTRIVPAHERTTYEAQLDLEVAPQYQARASLHLRSAPPRDEYAVIDQVWPLRAENAMVGMEVAPGWSTWDSLQQARSSARLVMSAPHALLQEDRVGGAGLLIRAPVFVRDESPEGRRLHGTVNASFRTQDFLQFVLTAMSSDEMDIAIQDVGQVGAAVDAAARDTLDIFRSAQWSGTGSGPVHVRDLVVFDRLWRLHMVPKASLLSNIERTQPWLVGAGGLVASALLALLVGVLVRQRQAARLQMQDTQDALQESVDRFQSLFHHCGMGVCKVDSRTGQLLQVNQRLCEMLGYASHEVLQKTAVELSVPQERGAMASLLAKLYSSAVSNDSALCQLMHRDGHVVWMEVAHSPLLGRNLERLGQHIAVLQDVSERRSLQLALEQREARLGSLVQALPLGMLITDAQQRIVSVNERFTLLTGYSAQDLRTLEDWWRLAAPDEGQRMALRTWVESARREASMSGVMPSCELAVHCKDGSVRALELSGSPIQGDFVFTLMDLSLRKQAEEKIRNLALFDMLTQLPNRRHLLERLGEAIGHSERHGTGGALLLIDIDNFKAINETQGHAVGDALIQHVAQRFAYTLAQGGQGTYTLARQGGDEFAIVLDNLPVDPLAQAQHTERLGRRMMESLEGAVELAGVTHHVTVSVGVATFDSSGDTVDELLQRAEMAMHECKNAGRNALRFFDPSMQSAILARAEMEADMRAALQQNQFQLYYQPQVQGKAVVGAEALVRWIHPVKGFISPAQFIPLAEENGLVLPLGQWVLDTACAQLAIWSREPGLAHLALSVNVSPLQFSQADFVQAVEAALALHRVRPDRLKLELTEGLLLSDVEGTIRKMQQLRDMGVGFSLDDFGTGYSSLSYLKRLPLEQLKIDQSFVRDVLSNTNDQAIAKTIVALAASLGLRVIAEGVETEAQRAFLDGSGCHAWQGYLFSPAVPVERFEGWVQEFTGHVEDALV